MNNLNAKFKLNSAQLQISFLFVKKQTNTCYTIISLLKRSQKAHIYSLFRSMSEGIFSRLITPFTSYTTFVAISGLNRARRSLMERAAY